MKNSKNFHEHLINMSLVSKTIKILLLAVAFTFSGALSASTESTKADPTKTISSEIQQLLKAPDFLIERDITAKVKVYINEDNEFVVLSVSTDSEQLASYIKSRLNYKGLKAKMNSGQKTFVVPVRLTQKG